MQKARRSQGYTIVEAMIFLAVSGAIFLVASAFISGKQAATEFINATTDIETTIQTTINNVSAGYYQGSNYACEEVSSNQQPVTWKVTGNVKGTNVGCIYLGAAMQFSVGRSYDSNYQISQVVGNRLANIATNQEVQTLQEAHPRTLYVKNKQLLDNLYVSKMYIKGTRQNITSFAFISSLGSYGAGQGMLEQLKAGATNVRILAVQRGVYGLSGSDAITSPVVMCLVGGNNQKASLTIGQQGGGLVVNLQKGQDIQSPCR